MLTYRFSDWLSRRTIAVSEAARERYVRLKAVPARKSGVITNGIETDEFVPNAAKRAEMRAEASVEENFIWLAVGRLAPAKDYPNLLHAFALLPKACAEAPLRQAGAPPAARLWIAGSGETGYEEGLRRLASELGIADSVRWLGTRQDVAGLLDAADGFVLASAWEGMPLAVGEAMAMAKPVVATDVGGVRELTGETGRLVPAKDSDALAETLCATMRLSAEERKRIGKAERQRILDGFSMERKAEEWEKLYEELAR
jgi:glycosyltransferase involved in cell wall biosynthesis